MTFFVKKSLVLAKSEVTPGTDPTPTAAANAIQVRNLRITPLKINKASLDVVRPWFGASPEVITGSYSEIEFEVQMAGSGAAGTAPKWGPLHKACAFSETTVASTSVTYALVSASLGTATIYAYMGTSSGANSAWVKMTMCMGTVDYTLDSEGVPIMKYKFTGLYNPITAQALPTGADYSGFIDPVAVNYANTSVMTVGGTAVQMKSLALSIGNSVAYDNRPNVEQIITTDRSMSGTVAFRMPLLSAKDYFSAARAGTTQAIVLTHGPAGNRSTLSLPVCSLGEPSFSDEKGMWDISFPFNAQPGAAGAAEFTHAVL